MPGERVSRYGASAMVLGLVGLGVVASVLSVSKAGSDARLNEARSAQVESDRLSAELRGSMSSLEGIDGIAADGVVSEAEFAAFTGDVVPDSLYAALAFAEEVPESGRAEWERRTGIKMLDTDGAGGFRPAARRPEHVVVRMVFPRTGVARGVVGFDLMSDPVRARAVRESQSVDRAVLVGPIRLASSGGAGLFTMHAVRTPSGAILGYVSSGLNLASMAAESERAGGPEISLLMDGKPIFGSGSVRGSTTRFVLGGRTFTLEAASTESRDWTLPLAVGGGALALSALAVATLHMEVSTRNRARRRAARNERIALFAEVLSTLNATDAVVAHAALRAGDTLAAARTELGRIDLSEPSKLVVLRNDDDHATTLSLNDPAPLSDCARLGEPVLLMDRAGYEVAYGRIDDGPDRAAMSSTLCIPLALGSERRGAICFMWDRGIPRSEREDVLAAGLLVAQIIGRAYERARAREVVAGRVSDLAEFTRALTTSRSSLEVRDAVDTLLAPLFAAESVTLLTDVMLPPEPGCRCYALTPPEAGYLHLRLTGNTMWNDAVETLAHTIVDLISAALVRTRSYDEQSGVLQRLQHSLLTHPPDVEGFDIAVAYQSAVEAVGIGGDWYSVIDRDHHMYAVVGDVAGHGAEAVAVMAEVKTIVRYLLTTGTELLRVVQEADALLRRRRSFASLVAVEIDKRTGDLSYVSAGHPPPVLIEATSRSLDVPQGPWLGLDGSTYELARGVMRKGATLLLYTDGLIEQRGVCIDDTVSTLVERTAMLRRMPAALIDTLLSDRLRDRTVDDDIAVLALHRR